MELNAQKRSKRTKRQKTNRNRRRNNQKFQAKLARQSHRKTQRFGDNVSSLIKNCNFYTMTADTFWANYKFSQDWQQRHNAAWWKSRCTALEYENNILRNKLRSKCGSNDLKPSQVISQDVINYADDVEIGDIKYEVEVDEEMVEYDDTDNGDLEFQVDEEMMKFLEKSARHKMELKRNREFDNDISNKTDDNSIENHQLNAIKRIQDAKFLYGNESSRILALETALEANVDQYKDHAKPIYWPNIPFRP